MFNEGAFPEINYLQLDKRTVMLELVICNSYLINANSLHSEILKINRKFTTENHNIKITLQNSKLINLNIYAKVKKLSGLYGFKIR